MKNKQDIREEYTKLKKATDDTTCYACGQPLTGEKLELEKSVKAAKLKELADRKQSAERIEETRGRDTRPEDIERQPEILPRLPRRKEGIITKVLNFFKGLFR